MTKTRFCLALALLAATAACGKSDDHTLAPVGPSDPIAEQIANSAPVVLPPSIQASKTYRCKDNSLVYIDWMSDGTARVKAAKNDVGTAPAEGALTGDAKAATVTYKGQSCKA